MRSNLNILLHLIRHGETDRNRNYRLIGQSPEEPINKTGTEQSQKLADRLKKEGIQYDYLYSSPYVRAQETAKIIAEVMPKSMQSITVPELREINQGEGKDKDRFELYEMPGFKEKMDFVGSAFHFNGGETLFDVEYRAQKWLHDQILDSPFTRNDKELKIAIMTHGMTVKSLLHHFMQFDHRITWRVRVDNCSISQVRVKDGQFYIDSLNDIAHLL